MKYYAKEKQYGEITKIKCQRLFSPFIHEYKILKEMFYRTSYWKMFTALWVSHRFNMNSRFPILRKIYWEFIRVEHEKDNKLWNENKKTCMEAKFASNLISTNKVKVSSRRILFEHIWEKLIVECPKFHCISSSS